MAMTLQQLTTTPSANDSFNQMIAWLVSMGIPADKWRKGGVGRSLLMTVATTFYALGVIITGLASSGFLNTATGDWLSLLAKYVYGVTRITATQASGTIYQTNTGGNLYTWNPGDLIVQDAVTLKTYQNTTLVSSKPGDVSLPIPIAALEFGTASNANPGEITKFVSSVNGVSITNPAPLVATNDQSDTDLVAACLARLGALSLLGPRGAYAYAIQFALNGGTPVNITRWTISPSSSTGTVAISLASPSGAASVGDVAAVLANIEAVARPDTVTVVAAAAAVTTYTPTITVWARTTAGLDATALTALVLTALTNYIAKYAIGGLPKPPATQGYLYDESVRAICQAAHPSIFAVDTASPVDLPVAAGVVVQLLNPTISSRFVTQAST